MLPAGSALRAAALLLVGGGLLGACGPGNGAAACLDGGCGGAASAGHDAGADLADNDASTGTPGLVASYDFDQTAGTVALDSSGNFKNAGLIGQVSWGMMGYPGGDVSFVGMGGYLVLPPMLDQARAFSFVAWVKVRTDRIWQRVFDFGSGTTSYMFLTPHSVDDTFRFAISRNGAGMAFEQRLNGPVPLPAGAWKHVAVVLTGASGSLYLDGQPVATNPDLTLRPVDVAPFTNAWIGRSEFSDPSLDGELDQVRIYDRALSAAEVLALSGQP